MIIGTLLDELERTGQGTGLATLCVASGMGAATIIERNLRRAARTGQDRTGQDMAEAMAIYQDLIDTMGDALDRGRGRCLHCATSSCPAASRPTTTRS